MKITIKDIANECGVSVSTVSMALSDKPNRISPETKQKVKDAVQRLNYRPNAAAVSLAKKHSKLIGLIINDLRNTHIASLFMAIDKEVQKKGYSLITHVLLEDEVYSTSRQLLEKLLAENISALIWAKPYINLEDESEAFVAGINDLEIPVASMDDYGFTCPGVDVCFDYYQSAYMATKHLLEYGHTRIGCLAGVRNFKVTQDRLEGYKAAVKEAGIEFDEDMVYYGNYTMESGNEALPYLLGQKVTAVFSFNDEMAFGIYQSARQFGVKIPEELSIIGCDNVPFTNVMEVPLTTIQVPIVEMGSKLGKELVSILEGNAEEERSRIVYKPNLFLRGSTSRIK
jgi:LacI family transcriptional regulator